MAFARSRGASLVGEAASLFALGNQVNAVTVGRLDALSHAAVNLAVAHDANGSTLTNGELALQIVLGGAVVGGDALELGGGSGLLGQGDIDTGLAALNDARAELQDAVLLFIEESVDLVRRDINDTASIKGPRE